MVTGTNHFVSVFHAQKYYRNYGVGQEDVAEKVRNGEIKIGMPPRKANEKLVLLDLNTRYGVDDGKN